MSGLRQAAILTLAFLVVLVLTGAGALFELEREFTRRMESELQVRFDRIAAEVEAGRFDPTDYPASNDEVVRLVDAGRSGFFEQAERRPLRRHDHDDDDDRDAEERDFRGFHQWLFLGGPVEGGHLVVGSNLSRRDEFEEIAFETLVLVGLLSSGAAVIVGLWFGMRNQRRISAISSVLGQVAEGDLGARVNPARDRDDLDALARRVDDTTAQLDRLMRQTRDFSANIAHDLKTPLTRLRIRLETALTAELETGDSAEQIGAALEQTETVIGIFDAFLRIAKLESGATKAEFVPLKLVDLATEVSAAYGPVIEDAGRVFTVEADPKAQVTGDRVLLIQMLANMIENALRHTPEGTALRLVAREGSLGLADNGPGIPEAEHDKVLQPLYRLEKSRTGEGAGLGLALVRTIAELHGATVVLGPDPTTGRGLFIRAEFAPST